MKKQEIPKEAGRLKWLCNEAYFAVRYNLPFAINHKVLAFGLGVLSGYAAASAGEYAANKLDLPLEKIASHSLAATVSAPLIAYVIAPKNFRDFVRDSPTYSSGSLGVMTGASVKALDVLLF